jgi:phosphonatase-like hydrolase
MQIDLAVFDMAGTTVHDGDAVHACLQQALAAAGVAVSRTAVNAVMGMPKPLAIRQLLEEHLGGAPAGDARTAAVYDDFAQRMIAHYRHSPDVREIVPAREVFHELRASGIKVFLDTGFSRPVADVVLERLGWVTGEDIDGSVTSDEVTRGRPHPDMIRRAMALAGVSDPHRVAKIGDTPADLQEGAAAGCGLVIGVTEGSHTHEELEIHPHTHLMTSIAGLPALLRELDAAVAGER